MKIKLLLVFVFIAQSILAQIPLHQSFILSQEFSKEISLYKAKSFLIQEVLMTSDDIVHFEIDPLAASTSGELTSLVYSCKEKGQEGLILGFYGDFWNDNGTVYKGFAFKNLQKENALVLLRKLSEVLANENSYLSGDMDNNNVYIQFDDLYVLIYRNFEPRIRVFWKDFDSEWSIAAFNRTKKRFEKNFK